MYNLNARHRIVERKEKKKGFTKERKDSQLNTTGGMRGQDKKQMKAEAVTQIEGHTNTRSKSLAKPSHTNYHPLLFEQHPLHEGTLHNWFIGI